MKPETTHPLFLDYLYKSVDPVMTFTRHFVANGTTVEVLGMHASKNYSERMEYVDPGYDLIMKGKTFNIKGVNYTFSSVEEYAENFKQYKYPIAVSPTSVKNLPDYIAILSQDKKGCFLVPCHDQSQWDKRKIPVDRYGTLKENYVIKPDGLKWVDFTKPPKYL